MCGCNWEITRKKLEKENDDQKYGYLNQLILELLMAFLGFRVRLNHQSDVVGKRRWKSETAAGAAEVRRVATAEERSLLAAASRTSRRQRRRRPTRARSLSLSQSHPSRLSRCSSSSTRRAAAIRAPSFCTSSTGCWILVRCLTCRKADREWRKSSRASQSYYSQLRTQS